MLQLYFLSVAANFLAGMTLSADWMGERFTSLAGILEALSVRRAKTITGLAALLVGLGTLFVPAAPSHRARRPFPQHRGRGGGHRPALRGLQAGGTVSRADAVLPRRRIRGVPRRPSPKSPSAYRTALGALGFAAAILHYFLPERLFF